MEDVSASVLPEPAEAFAGLRMCEEMGCGGWAAGRKTRLVLSGKENT